MTGQSLVADTLASFMCTYLDLTKGAEDSECQIRGKVWSPAQLWGSPQGFSRWGHTSTDPAQGDQKQMRCSWRYTDLMKSDWGSEMGKRTFSGGWEVWGRDERECEGVRVFAR